MKPLYNQDTLIAVMDGEVVHRNDKKELQYLFNTKKDLIFKRITI